MRSRIKMDLGRLLEQFQLFLCCIPGFAKPERRSSNPSRPRGIVDGVLYLYVLHCPVKACIRDFF